MKLIFEKEIMLCPQDSKTNAIQPFKVEDDFIKMEIYFSYSPKVLADRKQALSFIDGGMQKFAPGAYRDGYRSSEAYLPVQNLLTLSMDSPEGYVGCAHRHAPEQLHIISGSFSSPGFEFIKPLKGSWRAVINIHAVVTEPCICRLKVIGIKDSGVNL